MHLAGLDLALDYGARRQRELYDSQISLFGIIEESTGVAEPLPELPNVPEFTDEVLLEMENELLGLYISGHPLEKYIGTVNSQEITRISEVLEAEDGSSHHIIGMIKTKQQIMTKRGQLMGFLVIEDLTSSIEVVVFSELYQEINHMLDKDRAILLKAKVQQQDEQVKLIAEKITDLSTTEYNNLELKKTNNRKLYIKYDYTNDEQQFRELLGLLAKYSGDIPVVLYNPITNQYRALNSNYNIVESTELVSKLLSYVPNNSIVFK